MVGGINGKDNWVINLILMGIKVLVGIFEANLLLTFQRNLMTCLLFYLSFASLVSIIFIGMGLFLCELDLDLNSCRCLGWMFFSLVVLIFY